MEIKDGRRGSPPIYHPNFGKHSEAQSQAMSKRDRFEFAKELYIKHIVMFGVSAKDAVAQFEDINSDNVTKKQADNLFNALGEMLQALSHAVFPNRGNG